MASFSFTVGSLLKGKGEHVDIFVLNDNERNTGVGSAIRVSISSIDGIQGHH